MNFTTVFLAAILISLGIRLYLAFRQVKHIQSHQHQVPSAFLGQMSLEAHQKAARYSIAKTRLGSAHILFEALVLLSLTLYGGLNWIQMHLPSWADSVLGSLCLIGAVGLVSSVLELPWDYYKQFVLEAEFGFNRMTKRLFWTDWAKGLVLGTVLGGPLLALVLWLMREAGSAWWAYAWLAWFAFSLLLMWLFPTVIAPLFNTFKPLDNTPTRQRIVTLLQRCGFQSNGLFVMDGSKRSSHGNAYFSGLGKAKRIVFFDTLLARLSDAQIEAVLAHELGHFKKKHIQKHLVFSGAASLLMFWVLGQLSQADWFFTALGTTPNTNSAEGLAVLLFMMVLPYFTFPIRPVMSWLSRKHEFEADAYAAQHSDSGHLISALVRLYEDNASTLTPDPLHSAFYDSHPPASIRIAHLKQLEAHA